MHVSNKNKFKRKIITSPYVPPQDLCLNIRARNIGRKGFEKDIARINQKIDGKSVLSDESIFKFLPNKQMRDIHNDKG